MGLGFNLNPKLGGRQDYACLPAGRDSGRGAIGSGLQIEGCAASDRDYTCLPAGIVVDDRITNQ